MSNNRINKETLNNLSNYDEMQLLDNIEDMDYLKNLLFDDPDLKQRSLTQTHLKLFKKLVSIKDNDELDQTDLWAEAIELERTLWHAGVVINDMLYKVYELLATNPELGYELDIDPFDEMDDDEE